MDIKRHQRHEHRTWRFAELNKKHPVHCSLHPRFKGPVFKKDRLSSHMKSEEEMPKIHIHHMDSGMMDFTPEYMAVNRLGKSMYSMFSDRPWRRDE
ncbi:MAG: hypothetical protein ACYTFY_15090 [Planctomycetota bacterium]|jgi:hypothetical protein